MTRVGGSGASPPHGAEAPFLCFSLGAALAAGRSGLHPPSAPGSRGAWRAGAAAAGRGAAVPGESRRRGPAARVQVTAGRREGQGRREQGRGGMRGRSRGVSPRSSLARARHVPAGTFPPRRPSQCVGPGRSRGAAGPGWRGPAGSSARRPGSAAGSCALSAPDAGGGSDVAGGG